jgi:hypothetical protein
MFGRRLSEAGIIFTELKNKHLHMSHAFVRESDEQWLHDIPPTLGALVNYLTRENNGIRVYEKRTFADPKTAKEVHEMSNGLSYSIDQDGRWYIYG